MVVWRRCEAKYQRGRGQRHKRVQKKGHKNKEKKIQWRTKRIKVAWAKGEGAGGVQLMRDSYIRLVPCHNNLIKTKLGED